MKARIALAQAESDVGNVPANLRTAVDLIGRAGEAKADLVLFCELFLQGCVVEADFAHTAVSGGDDVMHQLSEAASANDLSVVIGTARREEGFPHNVYNSAAVFSPRGFQGFYDKLQVANYATYNEALSFARGTVPKTFDLPFGRIGVCICYDIMFPEVSLALALSGAVLQVVPAAGGGEFASDWDALLTVRSKENQMFLAYCNAIGKQGSEEFIGRSRVVGPDGMARGPAAERARACLTLVDIDLDDVRTVRHQRPIFRDRPTLAAAIRAFGGTQD